MIVCKSGRNIKGECESYVSDNVNFATIPTNGTRAKKGKFLDKIKIVYNEYYKLHRARQQPIL